MEALNTYFWNVLVGLDQMANVLLGGYPDETISSRAAKAARAKKRWGCVLCKFLSWFEKNHCEKRIELDEGNSSTLP